MNILGIDISWEHLELLQDDDILCDVKDSKQHVVISCIKHYMEQVVCLCWSKSNNDITIDLLTFDLECRTYKSGKAEGLCVEPEIAYILPIMGESITWADLKKAQNGDNLADVNSGDTRVTLGVVGHCGSVVFCHQIIYEDNRAMNQTLAFNKATRKMQTL